mgnify:CR=1 FL=1
MWTPPTTPSETLEKALQVLLARGFCKGKLSDHMGRVCSIGAVNMALTGSASAVPAGSLSLGPNPLNILGMDTIGILQSTISEITDGLWSGVASYNDHEDTTLEDVCGLITRAIEIAETRDA